jgi:hypothetical protein
MIIKSANAGAVSARRSSSVGTINRGYGMGLSTR